MGAPFDGNGKVFIYRGSDAGIETKPAQVIPKVLLEGNIERKIPLE